MPASTPVARARGKVGGLKRSIRNGERKDNGILADAERDLAIEVLAERAKRVVAAWPDLTDAQVDRIAAILRGTGD